jgi:purine-binding chemotaxis protein CheW
VPQAPPFVCGVINLRGKVVPVVDLKARLGVPPVEAARGCIVVMQPRSGKDALQIGVVVDGVSEVMHIPAAEVEDTASFSQGLIETSFISGVAKTRGHVKMLLNIDAALAIDQPVAMVE